ncbi:hypothetical protein J7S99_11265 [Providencia rettgeri]|uniref:hypothetical protein n=1 Tax=Providencia rettgeri TaxID=587 RepID=UPI001B36B165|nr:hypothetical protein [Providencia rettgeri]MBQ0398177.1 hypothetical protein [Providencia rettgeri]
MGANFDIKNNEKHKEIESLLLSIENRIKKTKGTENSLRKEINELKAKKYTDDGVSSAPLVSEMKRKLSEITISRIKHERMLDSMNETIQTRTNKMVGNLELDSVNESKMNERINVVNLISKFSHNTKNKISDSARSNIINANNQTIKIKQAITRVVELTKQINSEYKEARLKLLVQTSNQQAISEQISSFSMPDEVSSVMDNAIESPTKMNSIAHHNYGGLDRTGQYL